MMQVIRAFTEEMFSIFPASDFSRVDFPANATALDRSHSQVFGRFQVLTMHLLSSFFVFL